MRPHLSTIAFLVIGAAANGCATVSDRVPSLEAAYGIVIAYAHEHHLALNDAHPGAYYCDFAPKSGVYFVVALLRHDETAPRDWVGSESVGWYGVDERDGSIVAWDVAQDMPGRKLQPGTERGPNKPPLQTPSSVTPAADAPVAPLPVAAGL